MGYSTEFEGRFDLNKPLDDKTYDLLIGLAQTRRVTYRVRKEDGYGIDGEFYVGEGPDGPRCMDSNRPPRTQAGLWMQWVPTADRMHLEWDGNEKFYAFVAWLEYLSNRILRPAGYELNGTVSWTGEDPDDTGKIVAVKGDISIQDASDIKRSYAYMSMIGPMYDIQCATHGRDSETIQPADCYACKIIAKIAKVLTDNDIYYEGGEVEEVNSGQYHPFYGML